MNETIIRNLIISHEEHFEYWTDKMIKKLSKNNDKKRIAKAKELQKEAMDELYEMSEKTIELLIKLMSEKRDLDNNNYLLDCLKR